MTINCTSLYSPHTGMSHIKTLSFSSRTLLDAFQCTFPNPKASAVVKFCNSRLYKSGLYILYVYPSQNEVHCIFSSVKLHPPAYSCCDYTLNKRVRGVVDIARHSGSFNLRNVYTPAWSFRQQRPKIETLRLIVCNSAWLCVYVRACVWGFRGASLLSMAARVFLDFHKNSTARNGVKEDRKLFMTAK